MSAIRSGEARRKREKRKREKREKRDSHQLPNFRGGLKLVVRMGNWSTPHSVPL